MATPTGLAGILAMPVVLSFDDDGNIAATTVPRLKVGAVDGTVHINDLAGLIRCASVTVVLADEAATSTDAAFVAQVAASHDVIYDIVCSKLDGPLATEARSTLRSFDGRTPSSSEVVIATTALRGWVNAITGPYVAVAQRRS